MARDLTYSRGVRGLQFVKPDFGDLALSNHRGLLNPDITLPAISQRLCLEPLLGLRTPTPRLLGPT